MSTNDDLERRIAQFYATEAPSRAPDRVLESALETIDITRQRHAFIRVPWRSPAMNSFAKWAIAAVAVIAVGAVGLAVFGPGSSPDVGGPGATPSSTPAPTAPPTPSPTPTFPPTPTYEPPALTEAFTSDIHGISISYPAGWLSQPATAPWTTTSWILFREPAGDFLYDPSRTDHLFLELASAPLVDVTFDQWAAELLVALDCPSSEPVVIDGADGVLCGAAAAVPAGGRGYLLALYTSDDNADLRAFDSQAWFEEILVTVQLLPENAIDIAPSAST
jgi:hypothetical protein